MGIDINIAINLPSSRRRWVEARQRINWDKLPTALSSTRDAGAAIEFCEAIGKISYLLRDIATTTTNAAVLRTLQF